MCEDLIPTAQTFKKKRFQSPDTCSSVRIYNVKTNFTPTTSTGHSSSTTAMQIKQQGCDGDNVVVAQVQISVDFKKIDPKITEEMIITGNLEQVVPINMLLLSKTQVWDHSNALSQYHHLLLSNHKIDQIKKKHTRSIR